MMSIEVLDSLLEKAWYVESLCETLEVEKCISVRRRGALLIK